MGLEFFIIVLRVKSIVLRTRLNWPVQLVKLEVGHLSGPVILKKIVFQKPDGNCKNRSKIGGPDKPA